MKKTCDISTWGPGGIGDFKVIFDNEKDDIISAVEKSIERRTKKTCVSTILNCYSGSRPQYEITVGRYNKKDGVYSQLAQIWVEFDDSEEV